MINKEIRLNRLSSVPAVMTKNRFNGAQVMKQRRIILGAWLALPRWMNTDLLFILLNACRAVPHASHLTAVPMSLAKKISFYDRAEDMPQSVLDALALALIELDILNNPVIFPSNENLANAELILPLRLEGQQLYKEIWERFSTVP
jgi:hypothetical protein